MNLPVWTGVVEGDADAAVLEAVVAAADGELHRVVVCGGKGALDRDLHRYLQAAEHSNWVVLRDLDQDAACAATWLTPWRTRAANRCVRVAVRAVEAWLLADDAAADWLAVPRTRLPRNVESLDHPKRALIDLARRSSDRHVRRDVVPRGTASIGPGYVEQVRRFCRATWRPREAARRCDSLARCLRFLAAREDRSA